MKKLFLLIYCSIAMNQLLAQWYQVNSGTDQDIHDICFKDSLTGFGVTKNAVIKTIDGGENWNVFFSDTSLFSNMSVIVAGDSINIFCQDSLGRNYKLTFPGNSSNYIKQNIVYRPWHPIYFNKEIWYIQNSALKKYTNGSITTMLTFSGLQYFFVRNDFISAASATDIYASTDYGITWDTIQYTTSPLSSAPYQSYFDGRDTIIAVTNYPTIIHYSYDAGFSWNYYHTPAYYFYFIDSETMLGLNLYNSNKNIVGISLNGGYSFNADTLLHPINACYIYSNNLCFVFGEDGTIYKNSTIGRQVGIDEIKTLKKKIKVYPNPSTKFLTIEIANDLQIEKIEMMNMQGKVVRNYGQNERYLKVKGLECGYYLLQFYTTEGIVSKKVLLE